MFFNTVNSALAAKLNKLVPEMQQLLSARFVNFLTMNVSSIDYSWAPLNEIFHEQHAQALAYMQCNFRNHIVNMEGIQKIKQIANYLQQKDQDELLSHYWPQHQKKVAEANRKRFYVMEKSFSIQQIMECQLMLNKSFDKVICFPKSQPLQLNTHFEKFCVQHNIKAMGLTQFNLRSLLFQISKTSNSSTLIHDRIQKDSQIYKDPTGKNVPTQLIIFMKKVNQAKLKSNNFPTFKQILKNYMPRQTFKKLLGVRTKDFSIARLQHLTEVANRLDAIQQQQNAMKDQDEF